MEKQQVFLFHLYLLGIYSCSCPKLLKSELWNNTTFPKHSVCNTYLLLLRKSVSNILVQSFEQYSIATARHYLLLSFAAMKKLQVDPKVG